MVNDKFTRGDWMVSHEPSNGLISEDDAWSIIAMDESNEPWHIAAVWKDVQGGGQQSEYNAHLLAASKKLYEACAEFVRKVECGEAKSTRSYNQMKEAMAVAEGDNNDQ